MIKNLLILWRYLCIIIISIIYNNTLEMLIDVSVKNYLSFKDETTFSLKTESGKKDNNTNIISLDNNIGILRTSAIYGYNASGKTNFLKAIFAIRTLVVDSRRLGPNEPLWMLGGLSLQPFRLNTTTQNLPAEFKIHFEISGTIYKYVFSFTGWKIVTEKLSCRKTQKEKTLFKREGQNIKIYDFNDNNSIPRVNENNLALSIFAKEGSEDAKKIHKFFQEIYVFLGPGDMRDSGYMMKNEAETFKPFLKELLENSDFGIEDINFSSKEIPFSQIQAPDELINQLRGMPIPEGMNVERHTWSTIHPVYDDNGKRVGIHSFGLQDESQGTNKILNLAGSIYDVIRQGKILFIDELDTSLHTSLLIRLIQTFNKVNTNSRYQIVFTTQDTHIMDIKRYLRRDQIWFARKDKFGASRLYRLSDLSIRKEYISEKNYYNGKFGGLKDIKKSDLFNLGE